jgi:hypothetical protein
VLPEDEGAPVGDPPDPSDEHKLLHAEGRVLAKVREAARQITERVWRALGHSPPEPPDANPPAVA